MIWRKKTKLLDPSKVKDFIDRQPGAKLRGLAERGVVIRPALTPVPPRPVTFEEVWRRLPPESWWDILNGRRVASLDDGDEVSEWWRYFELMKRTFGRHQYEVFVGLDPATGRPQFAPRQVFRNHAYILGLPGSFKTTFALAQLLLQLGDEWVDSEGVVQPPPPLIIMDLKENGDRYLRSLAEFIAARRGQKLRFYSNDPDYVSLRFNPLQSLRSIRYPLKLGETLLKALSLIYREGYGSDFFTSEQRKQLLQTLYEQNPKTLDELIRLIGEQTQGKSGNTDARGLFSALQPLQYSFHLTTDGRPLDDQHVNLEQIYERGEVLYVHLNSRSQSIDAKIIGKLLVFALMEVASERMKHGRKRQMFVAIDEFQRLAAQNIVEVLEDSRSLGVGFMLSHQSPESLHTRDVDLYKMIADLCSFNQYLSLTNSRIIESLKLVSGRKREIRRGGSTARSSGIQTTRGTSWQRGTSFARNYEYGLFGMAETGFSRGTSSGEGGTSGTSESSGETSTESWTEEMVPGLTPEMIAAVNGTPRLSLVHIHNAEERSLTHTGGIPALVQGLHPFTLRQAEAMEAQSWPMQSVPTDEFYERARPRVSVAAVDDVLDPGGRSARKRPQLPAPKSPRPQRDEAEERKLKQRIRAIADRLEAQMLVEAMSVERFARREQLSVPQVVQLAQAMNVAVKNKEHMLGGRTVKKLRQVLRGQRTSTEGREKDNGPPQEPVV
ncbi:MAG: hypothetical protein IPM64_07795 [Phycisphaerales bacterium]|nr:hypothetical protein [Phycisphaerales bacterium]